MSSKTSSVRWESATSRRSWSAQIHLSPESLANLAWWTSRLRHWNGRGLIPEARGHEAYFAGGEQDVCSVLDPV